MTQKQAALYTIARLALVLGIAVFLIGKAFTDNRLTLALYAVVSALAVIKVKAWARKGQVQASAQLRTRYDG